MSTLSLRLPESLHKHVKELASREGVSINQFIATAGAEKMSALMAEDYLRERAAREPRQDAGGSGPSAGPRARRARPALRR
jgi:hypothetical protein